MPNEQSNPLAIINMLGTNIPLGGFLWHTLGEFITNNSELYEYELINGLMVQAVMPLAVLFGINPINYVDFLIGFLEYYGVLLFDFSEFLWRLVTRPQYVLADARDTLMEVGELIALIMEEGITVQDLRIIFYAFNESFFEDTLWLMNNRRKFIPGDFSRLTRSEARELGRRTGGMIAELVTAGAVVYGGYKTGLAIRSALSWARQKIIFYRLSLNATNNPNSRIVVIGKNTPYSNSYQRVAQRRGATFFEVDEATWNSWERLYGRDNIWYINEQFMRTQLAQNKTFILSHDPNTATGFFLREVNFLRANGFHFIPDGDVWLAVNSFL
jgi:hypothetical protein